MSILRSALIFLIPVLLLAPFVSASASARVAVAVAFANHDWELRCDNLLTCRVAGYQSEGPYAEPVSILLTRAAGPATRVSVAIQLGGGTGVSGPARMSVGDVVLTGLSDMAELKLEQVSAVLPELVKNNVATFHADGKSWELSLAGLKAVLLKMDEAQGRLDTPGALVKRGKRSESAVTAPIPAPDVPVVLPVAADPGDAALARKIFAELDLKEAKTQCNGGLDVGALSVRRLTADKLLLSMGCSMGAYNHSELNWIANAKAPYLPRAIEADGEFDADAGSITSVMKTRGVGDCLHTRTWYFNGQDFALTQDAGDGMCRGFAGGAWGLVTFTARPVVQPAPLTAKTAAKTMKP